MKHYQNPTFKAVKTMLHLSQKVGSFFEEIGVSQTIPPLSILPQQELLHGIHNKYMFLANEESDAESDVPLL